MAKFVLIVSGPGEAHDAVNEACHKTVDDGRLWDLLLEAVAEDGTERDWEIFGHAGDIQYPGELRPWLRSTSKVLDK